MAKLEVKVVMAHLRKATQLQKPKSFGRVGKSN
jgi:hypothetical protein